MKPWLQFFRIVNLPTVPGDVLVGAAAAALVSQGGALIERALPLGVESPGGGPCETRAIAAAALASCALYLFGLADNDIVGAMTDGSERPIPSGAISLRAARIARGLCLFSALVVGAAANLPSAWWVAAFALAAAVVLYNRTKNSVLMGLCRGLNVVCGGVVALAASCGAAAGCGDTGVAVGLCGALIERALALVGVALLWTLYIFAVTKYSEGESDDPVKRRTVGILIGALVYLQLGALLLAYLMTPNLALRNLLLAGAGLLVLLRLMKRLFPKVSAS